MPFANDVMRDLRESQGLTMQGAADALTALLDRTWTRQNWYRIESGDQPSVNQDVLWAIARVLHCQMDDLVTRPHSGSRSGVARRS